MSKEHEYKNSNLYGIEKRRHRTQNLNAQRLKYAREQLFENGIVGRVMNEETCQINVKVRNKTYTFYAGTGKIVGEENRRGIKAFIELIKKEFNRDE